MTRRIALGVIAATLVFASTTSAQTTTPTYPYRSLLTPLTPALPVPAFPTLTPSAPVVVGTDGTFLGKLNDNPYDANSIANPYGRYGSPYSADSVNNPYGRYGSPYSSLSATNPYTSSAPIIVAPRTGSYLGRLSTNPYQSDSTANPYSPYGSPYSGTSINNPYSPYYVPPSARPTRTRR